MLYKVLRVVYISFWFYYLPVAVMIFANVTPVIQNMLKQNEQGDSQNAATGQESL